MASLATARTRLSLYGGPLRPAGDFLSRVTPTDFAVSDTWSVTLTEAAPVIDAFTARDGYTSTFSKLSLSGVPQRFGGDFTKEVISTATIDVTDTWLATLTEDPVDSNEIVGLDDWRASLTETINLRNNAAVTDSWPVTFSETIGLLQAGVLLQSVTDTWSVTLTEGTADVRVSLDVTDTLSATWTEAAATVDTPLEILAVTDDWLVTYSGEEASLGIFAGIVPITAEDAWNVAINDTGARSVTQPVGAIKFRITAPHIRFEFV